MHRRLGPLLTILTLGTAAIVAARAIAADTKASAPVAVSPLTPISNDAMMLGGDFSALSAVLGADNAVAGPRTVPGRVIPVPTTISPQFKAQVSAPYRAPDWNADPKTPLEWRDLVAKLAAKGAAKLPALREKLGVTSEPTTLGGVKAFRVAAKTISAAHRGKVIYAIHGGGFVYNPGEAGTLEAVLMAGFGGYEVYAIDYRMAPDHPFPAANDDVMAGYKALLKDHKPGDVAIVGTSAGAGLALALCLRAKAEGVPLPAVIAPGTPEADMTNQGRHGPHQRMARQRTGQRRRLHRGGAQGLRAGGARSEGPAALADLRRFHRPAAGDHYLGHARPVPVQRRARAPQAAPGRRRGHAAGLRGHEPRAISLQRRRAGDQGGLHGDRRLLRPALGALKAPRRLKKKAARRAAK